MALVPHAAPQLPVVPSSSGSEDVLMKITSQRKSGLHAPTMLLTGHTGEVFAGEFSPDGKALATASADKNILIYKVYGECENYGILKGHRSAILELHWNTDGTWLYTASADKSAAVWDVEEGKRLKKLSRHSEILNTCSPNRRGVPLLATGSDDGTVKIWDMRTFKCVKNFEHTYQILSVAFDDLSERVFAGTIDNSVLTLDMRIEKATTPLLGHADSITGISVSNEGTHLLSHSMDQTIRLWDIRPYCSKESRCVAVVRGATHNFEKNLLRVRWDRKDDRLFAAGSADRSVYVWEFEGGRKEPDAVKLQYRLPGHSGSVNDVALHPNEPIVASFSSDKKTFVGELG